MTNLDSILKSRDVTLPTKVRLVKAMVFPVVMYGWKSWTRKKSERQRIDAFKLWYWRRLLRALWTIRRCNQSILKEIRPECSLEELMLKLKLQYFGHLMQRTHSLEKTIILGKIEGRRRKGWQRMRWLDGITDSVTWVWVNSGSWWWTGRPGVLQSMGLQRVRHNWATELKGILDKLGIKSLNSRMLIILNYYIKQIIILIIFHKQITEFHSVFHNLAVEICYVQRLRI